MTPPALHDLFDRCHEFQAELSGVKRAIDAGFSWYPYESLSNVDHLAGLLRRLPGDVSDWMPARTVLDIGCGDGDLSFFLERGGFDVQAVDYAATNYNAMQGVRRLV